MMLCNSCGSLFIHPVPSERLPEIYPVNYYSFAQSQDSINIRIKAWLDKRYFRPILKKVPGEKLNALDVGGGTGWELNVLKQTDNRINFTQVIDLDVDAEKFALAYGHEYFCGRIEDFTSERQFDVILMLNLIEHLANPLEVLEQARALLSPAGIIIIKTPNIDSWDARLFRNKNWGGFHCPRHWTLFTKESLLGLVEKTGLRVVQINYTQGAPFWAMSVLFMLERMGWVSITRERPVDRHPIFGMLSAFFAGFDFVRGRFAKTSQMFFILAK